MRISPQVTLPFTSVPSRRSVAKMAAQKSKPSDLYKCVYSFLLENKFTKAAQQFLKQTNVVSNLSGVIDNRVDAFVFVVRVLTTDCTRSNLELVAAAGVSTCMVGGSNTTCYCCMK